ncbi:MAG TPA: hypothetical protein VK745_27085 [Polyangiaceae bacterium]|nr:hypothetical protein [Polyangiaceae bacterium]
MTPVVESELAEDIHSDLKVTKFMRKTRLYIHAIPLVSVLVALTTACSSSSSPNSSPGNTTPVSGTITGDGMPFVPADITYSLVDGGASLTLLAATLVDEGANGVYWVVAVRNDDTVPLCLPQVNAAFPTAADLDAGNLGGEAIVPVQGPMHQTSADGALPCLEPGDVGMGEQAVAFYSGGDPKVVEIDYQPRGVLIPDAVKVGDLAVENVKLAGTSAGTLVTGSVANHATTDAPGPELYLFPVDSGGRPFDFGYANSTMDLAAGSSWSFQLTVPEPVNKYVTFPVYGQQQN